MSQIPPRINLFFFNYHSDTDETNVCDQKTLLSSV